MGINIEGYAYPVVFLTGVTPGAGYSLASYPDVYAGDIITVLVTDAGDTAYSATVTAISYPTDYAKGTTLLVPSDAPILERGWQDTTSQGVQLPANTACYTKVQGNALT